MKLCKSFKYVECKRDKVLNAFRNGKFELLALNEAKLKGNGKVSWSEVNDIIAGVLEIERLGNFWPFC